jgi:transglutaminase-like putative cysteine protease
VRAGRVAATLLALIVGGCAAARSSTPAAPGLFLDTIPVSNPSGERVDLTAPNWVRIYAVAEDDRLAATVRQRFPDALRADGSVRIGVPARNAGVESIDPYRRATFVIDYDQPVFAALNERIRAAYGDHPTADELVRFTGVWIETKNLQRGYDVASTVARRREGDCTEHAVLLAALLRAHGYAARVVHGVVLIDAGGLALAFGHAWVEIADGAEWRVVDATHPNAPPVYLYIPVQTLADEGPNFDSEGTALLWISRLEIEPRDAASP